MNHTRSRSGLTRIRPRPSVLLKRLKRLNEDGLAEDGEDGYPGLLTKEGFRTLVSNANLKSVHLPYFRPGSPIPLDLIFHGTNMNWAVLSHIGENPDAINTVNAFEYLPKITFHTVNLNGASLDNANVSKLSFLRCNLIKTNVTGLVIDFQYHNYETDFVLWVEECDAEQSNFSDADINHSMFLHCNFKKAKFVNSTLYSTFENCNLNSADFSKAVLDKCIFINCTFVGTKFENADLMHCTFRSCDLMGIRFGNAVIIADSYEVCTNIPPQRQPPTEARHRAIAEYVARSLGDTEGEYSMLAGEFLYRRYNAHVLEAHENRQRMSVLDGAMQKYEEDRRHPSVAVVEKEPTDWTESDYQKCDNEVLDDGKKECPISFSPLNRGTGMVMVKKYGRTMDDELMPDCFNRNALTGWFDTQIRSGARLSNPKNRDKITTEFFKENGGFPPIYSQNVLENRGGRTKKTKSKSKTSKIKSRNPRNMNV